MFKFLSEQETVILCFRKTFQMNDIVKEQKQYIVRKLRNFSWYCTMIMYDFLIMMPIGERYIKISVYNATNYTKK
jgi:hypothetical protein